jgi:hypothetical protein
MADAATESTVPPEVLKTFTDALTSSLGSAMATSSSSGSGGIQVMVGTTPQNGFTLNIIVNGTTYGVGFGMPNVDNPAWSVSVTMTTGDKTPQKLLTFNYTPATGAWHLAINTPGHTFGSVTIDPVTFGMGSTGTPKV